MKPSIFTEQTGYKKNLLRRTCLALLGGLLLLLFAMTASVMGGASDIPVKTLWEAVTQYDAGQSQHLIIMDLRLPRVVTGAMVGASLAVAGAMMQAMTKNPLADSGLMGLNAGAVFSLSVCFAFFPGLRYQEMMWAAFAGAALGAGLVIGASGMRGGTNESGRIVLAGAAVSALLTAFSQGIALHFNVSQKVMFWTTGGTAGANWQQIKGISPWIAAGLIGAFLLARSISLLSLGQETAKGLGVNTGAVNAVCSCLVFILAGAAVSIAGGIGFVGLMVPHIVRYFVGMDYRSILPVSAIFGAALVVAADFGARLVNPPFETPLGAVVALLGGPFFLYLACSQRRRNV